MVHCMGGKSSLVRWIVSAGRGHNEIINTGVERGDI